MRIVFIGGKRRGYLCLQKILQSPDYNVVGVCCLTEDLSETIYYPSLRELSQQHDIPAWSPDNINSPRFLQILRELSPDLILVIGWYQIISKKIRDIPPRGCIALHDSYLPQYRGSATTNWPIIHGESNSGVTLFHLEAGMDTGDVILQYKVPISQRDTARTLLDRKDDACVELVMEALPLIKKDQAARLPQIHREATYMARRIPEDGLINWEQSTVEIDRLIRALSYPFPGAFSFYDDRKVFIEEAEPVENTAPKYYGLTGQIVCRKKGRGVFVLTGDGVLCVKALKFENSDRMDAYDVLKPTGSKLGLHLLDIYIKWIEVKKTIDMQQQQIELLWKDRSKKTP